ncbi:MAG: ABC transporter substrate-binding protein, partial [Clostridia bacterium]|nr:ABC transporter substrate-binding protein [Clostridia bacterium]
DIYTDILLLGSLTGKQENAQQLVDEMRNTIAEIGARAGAAGKTVYFEESPLQWGLWTAGAGTYMDDLAKLVGLNNVFGDLEGHNAVSEDAVIMRDPDIIITTTQYYGGELYPDQEIAARAGWGDLTAVKEGRVAYDPTNAINLPGPRVVDVARLLYDLAAAEAEVPAA